MITFHRAGTNSHLSGRHTVNKLTPEIVREVRAAYIPYKVTYAMLARKHGCHWSTIKDACTYTTWKDVR